MQPLAKRDWSLGTQKIPSFFLAGPSPQKAGECSVASARLFRPARGSWGQTCAPVSFARLLRGYPQFGGRARQAGAFLLNARLPRIFVHCTCEPQPCVRLEGFNNSKHEQLSLRLPGFPCPFCTREVGRCAVSSLRLPLVARAAWDVQTLAAVIVASFFHSSGENDEAVNGRGSFCLAPVNLVGFPNRRPVSLRGAPGPVLPGQLRSFFLQGHLQSGGNERGRPGILLDFRMKRGT